MSNLFEESEKTDDRTKAKNVEVKWEVIFKGMHTRNVWRPMIAYIRKINGTQIKVMHVTIPNNMLNLVTTLELFRLPSTKSFFSHWSSYSVTFYGTSYDVKNIKQREYYNGEFMKAKT